MLSSKNAQGITLAAALYMKNNSDKLDIGHCQTKVKVTA